MNFIDSLFPHQDHYLYNSFIISFCSFIICFTLTFICAFISKSFLSYQKLVTGKKIEWNCRFVALMHAIFAIIFASISIITNERGLQGTELMISSSNITRFTECVCLGYFIFDLIVMVYYWNVKGTNYFGIDGILHAIMCIWVYITCLFYDYGMYVTVLHLVFEYSTPMLHFRWYFIQTKNADKSFAVFNNYLFAFVFFIARIICGPLFSYWYISAMLAETTFRYVNFLFLPNLLIANGLNYYWFVLIIKGAQRKPNQKNK